MITKKMNQHIFDLDKWHELFDVRYDIIMGNNKCTKEEHRDVWTKVLLDGIIDRPTLRDILETEIFGA